MNNPTPTTFKDNGIAISQIGPYNSVPSKWETDIYQLLPECEVKRTTKHEEPAKHFKVTSMGMTKTSKIGNGIRVETIPISIGKSIYDLLPT